MASTGAGWSVRLAAHAADGVTQTASAQAADLVEAARAAADRLAPRLGGAAPEGTEAPVSANRPVARPCRHAGRRARRRAPILTAAPELQRAQPRLQYQLARVDFRAGEHIQGLERLDRLLAEGGATEPLFRAQVLNARGAMLVRLERLEEAEAAYDASVLASEGHPAELGQALSGRAVVHAMDGRFDQALDFSRARVVAERATPPVARIDANLGSSRTIADGRRRSRRCWPKPKRPSPAWAP